ncbi:hypothetical protein ZIOFF_041262 [Zingiber officinale]|uniref:F-box domain-containing protein n=1 Tax=Zingiber officinale TaxID=94328 RepID=A0A8J5KVX9_ZINOF|nr:hypothetical protein ZIOFF_041262 [Zingiber officinale]
MVSRSSLGQTSRAFLGQASRAFPGQSSRSSLSQTSRAFLGPRSSLGQTSRSSLGQTSRAFLGQASRAFAAQASRSSLGQASRAFSEPTPSSAGDPSSCRHHHRDAPSSLPHLRQLLFSVAHGLLAPLSPAEAATLTGQEQCYRICPSTVVGHQIRPNIVVDTLVHPYTVGFFHLRSRTLRGRMVGGRPLTGDLNIWFKRLILSGDGRKIEETGEVMARWKDLPMELLLRILSLVDDQTVIVASGVCTSWRKALRLGLTKFSLSWYYSPFFITLLYVYIVTVKLLLLPLELGGHHKYTVFFSIYQLCVKIRVTKEGLIYLMSLKSYSVNPGCKCQYQMNSLVQSLAPKFIQLQVLSLRQNCRSQLEDSAVEIIASYCHELRDLDLSKSFRLSDSSLLALAHGCSHLTKLNISGCEGFSDSALAYLAIYCKNLKSLNLCGCVRAATDRALQAISCNCCKLQYLNLGWCEHVSDAGVISLAASCPDIRGLNLCGCVQITDDSVIALANGCLHLRSLGLYYCKNITDRAMYSLANSRSKRKQGLCWQDNSHEQDGIVNLNVSQCTALTATAVQAVCDSFPGIHTCLGRNSLIISGCLNLTSVHCHCAIKLIRSVR